MIQIDIFTELAKQQLLHGDCLDVMRTMQENSIDFIVTDPPYGLHFMGKEWDGRIPAIEIWAEALRVSKPGSMLAAFGGSRTHHHLMCAIEGAGWEIRDVIMWIYGSGFPKSHNHFGLKGYGTALKPAHEPIIIAMRPLDGTFAQNADKWGVAGINIDESRIGVEERINNPSANQDRERWRMNNGAEAKKCIGRWPANIIFDEEAAKELDEQSAINASRFFYCAKASSYERNKGCENLPDKVGGEMCSTVSGDTRTGKITIQKNNHPTVKPISLMKYILKLLAPPGTPTCLDPFAGSGSTLVAAKELGINCIGIEKQEEYAEIAKQRVKNG